MSVPNGMGATVSRLASQSRTANPDQLLDPDVRAAAQHLLLRCRVTAEDDPELYRSLVRHRSQVTAFFAAHLDWTVVVSETAQMVRLRKRRSDPPSARGPMVRRSDREILATREVMVLAALVCEQLWRRPRMALRELLQAVSQVSAAETDAGTLPAFRIVASDGRNKAEASRSRQHLLDALVLLNNRGLLSADADLERARQDDTVDLVITANRERLALEIASVSPSVLQLNRRPPHAHVRALSAATLLDAGPPESTGGNGHDSGYGTHVDSESATRDGVLNGTAEVARDVDFTDDQGDLGEGPRREDEEDAGRQGANTDNGTASAAQRAAGARLGTSPPGTFGGRARVPAEMARARAAAALRRVVDDPGLDPTSDLVVGLEGSAGDGSVGGVFAGNSTGPGYLESITGRDRALTVAAALSMTVTARQDWWVITDPSGRATADDFPIGRRAERQAALALLDWVVRRGDDQAGAPQPLPTTPAPMDVGPWDGVVTVDDIVAVFEQAIVRVPRWARSYQRSLPALARAAAAQLVNAGLLVSTTDAETTMEPRGAAANAWRCTPGIHLWRVHVAYQALAGVSSSEHSDRSAAQSAPSGVAGSAPGTRATAEALPLFDEEMPR